MAISPGSTLADYLVPSPASRNVNLLRNAALVVGFSIFTALCAQVSFHLPITPVPVTLQTLAVLLTGAALGSRRGGLAMLVYLAEGRAPPGSQHFHFGPGYAARHTHYLRPWCFLAGSCPEP